MHETRVTISSAVDVGATLCLPERPRGQVAPLVLLLAGSGADTRDGDLGPLADRDDHGPGTMRQIAHHLAVHGVASLRWDRRGHGETGGDPATAGYHTDLEDALACLAWARAHEAVDAGRIAVAGHSAGALVACRVCRDGGVLAGAAFLGPLASPIDDFARRHAAWLRANWPGLSAEQRAWLERELPGSLVRAEGVERLLEGAHAGEEVVRLQGHGTTLEVGTTRLRQDLATSYADEFRAVQCPALVLHGGDDLNVPVLDATIAFRVLRDAGNRQVTLIVLPGLDHYFVPVDPDPAGRIWDRLSLKALRERPVAPAALDALAAWAAAVLAVPAGPRPPG